MYEDHLKRRNNYMIGAQLEIITNFCRRSEKLPAATKCIHFKFKVLLASFRLYIWSENYRFGTEDICATIQPYLVSSTLYSMFIWIVP